MAIRDFAALDAAELRSLLATHTPEEIRILGNMTPERWVQNHASAQALDAGGGHSFGKHGAHTTPAQQETRLRTGRAPNGDMGPIPPDASKFSSNAAHVEAAQMAERDLYNNMVKTNGQLKKQYAVKLAFPGAGFLTSSCRHPPARRRTSAARSSTSCVTRSTHSGS